MVSAFLALVVCTVVLLIFYLRHKYTYWERRGIPTFKGCIPLLGHSLPVLFRKINFSDFCKKACEEHKDASMIGLYNFLSPVLVLRESQLVKTVLQSNFSSFHKNGMIIQPDADRLLASNPFFSYGELWANGRKRLTYAFSSMRLKILFAAVLGVCKKFENYLNKYLGSNNKYEVELKDLFAKFTGEVVANAGLGIEGQCFDDTNNKYAFDNLGKAMFQPNFMRDTVLYIVMFLPRLNEFLKLGVVPNYIDKYFRQVVLDNLDTRRKELTPRNDFLQLMIDLEKTGENLDSNVIAAHAFSFFVDGYETSSTTLAFIGYHLARHPDIQEKLREEIKSTLAKYNGELTFEGLKEMKYMDQVINESQRCIPALGQMFKVCTEKFELQGSDGLRYCAEPGVQIIVPVHALHMNSDYWPNPEVFDPERFSEERKHSIEKMAFLPFGEGPRMCVGMRMAMLQMKSCITTLLRNYKLELSPKTQLPLVFSPLSILLIPIGGLWVHISKL